MNLVAGLDMGIYEEEQIYTKTGSRPIRFQYRGSGPLTDAMAYNNYWLLHQYHKILHKANILCYCILNDIRKKCFDPIG